MSVKSVYNFVPAPKESEVFKPDWAEQVSHDIPFSDGESGEIEFEIEAKTPIFIRNGHTKKDAEEQNDRYLSFSHVVRNGQKQYFIPGTSLKGMFRNVLEIMSLSRMIAANDIFAFRNLNHKKYKEEVATNNEIKTGWLVKQGGQWEIQECDFGRIEFHNYNRDKKTAIEKYEDYLENNNLENRFEKIKDLDHGRGSVYEENANGPFKGFIVFYGSIQNKKYEYIFTEPSDKSYSVSDDLINRFKSIYKLEQTQWQYFQSNNPYPKNRIPVFFLANEDTKEVKHFGFSRLYKMTNTKYVNELEPLNSYINRKKPYELDLAETIFGSVEDTEKEHGQNRRTQTLKGRVFFSHAFAITNAEELPIKSMVLASPKASYFPFYLKDKKTYMDDAELKGFKKYPLHTYTKESHLNEESQEIETKIKPLNDGVIFKGKVRYHNLRKVELGALLSAITFHGHNDLLDHNLGSAKPLGYGRIKIKLSNNGINTNKYLSVFEKQMQKHSEKYLRQDWLNLKALKELYAMSIDPVKDFLLKYPEIELPDVRSRDANEFANYVKNNTYLEDYSEFYQNKVLRFISVSEKYEKEKQKKEEAEQLQKKNESLLKEYLKKASDVFDKNDFETAKKIYEEALVLDIQKNESEIKKKIETCENKLEEIQRQYDEIINQADNYFKDEKWQEAFDKYIEAIKIKDDTYPRQQKNKCQKELEKDNINLNELKGLNDFNNGKKIIEKYYKSIGSTFITDKNSISVLKEFIKRCIEKSNKRWKKEGKQDWALVKKWVGQETAQKWFNEMMK